MSYHNKADKKTVADQFQYYSEINKQRTQTLVDEIKRLQQFNVYLQRLLGETQMILLRAKLTTPQELQMITETAKNAIFTPEQLEELRKISQKRMQDQNESERIR